MNLQTMQDKVAAATKGLTAVECKNQQGRDDAGEALKRAAAVVREVAAKKKEDCAPARKELADRSHRWDVIIGDLPALIEAVKQRCMKWDKEAAKRRAERTGEPQALSQAGKGGALENSYAVRKTFRVGDKKQKDFAACMQRLAHVVPPPNGEIVGESEWDEWCKNAKKHMQECVAGRQDFPAGVFPAEVEVFKI